MGVNVDLYVLTPSNGATEGSKKVVGFRDSLRGPVQPVKVERYIVTPSNGAHEGTYWFFFAHGGVLFKQTAFDPIQGLGLHAILKRCKYLI
jgi:hypothetical protein